MKKNNLIFPILFLLIVIILWLCEIYPQVLYCAYYPLTNYIFHSKDREPKGGTLEIIRKENFVNNHKEFK